MIAFDKIGLNVSLVEEIFDDLVATISDQIDHAFFGNVYGS
jgi:hypothetical protein